MYKKGQTEDGREVTLDRVGGDHVWMCSAASVDCCPAFVLENGFQGKSAYRRFGCNRAMCSLRFALALLGPTTF